MRDKLIKLLDNNKACDLKCDCYECQYDNEPTCFPVRLADALIANGVTLQQWIPVSERLPTERGRYWVWSKFYVRDKKVERPQVRYFSPELNAFTLDGGRDAEVTHWMPIEPPKEGDDERLSTLS